MRTTCWSARTRWHPVLPPKQLEREVACAERLGRCHPEEHQWLEQARALQRAGVHGLEADVFDEGFHDGVIAAEEIRSADVTVDRIREVLGALCVERLEDAGDRDLVIPGDCPVCSL